MLPGFRSSALFSLILALLAGKARAQAIVPTQRLHPEQYNIEQFFVLKTDTNVKHGPYRMVHYFTGEPICTGFYNRNKKDSLWREYCLWSNFVFATGKYINDQRVGEWTYFRKAGDTELRYNYNTRQVTFSTFDSGARKLLWQGGKKLVPCPGLERPVHYTEGRIAVMTHISKNLKYPQDAYFKGIHGMVVVAIPVDKDGKSGRPWVYTPVHPMLDKAALEVLNDLPPHWAPALYQGKPVGSVFFVEVPFVLL
ncbi:MAG: hypothetical protein EBZ77_03190 [Chitinophagia bacterium]|nr:hypothetical protein [Chitinophagia bacterium]